ncbi:MAG: hypothetical protein PHT02_03575 [Tissierellia bacterium]|nr:hypothetical protein [Tissierellia bacterium]
MLFGRNRVEEDLEKIRRANLPPEKLEEEDKIKKEQEESMLQLEKNDVLAMILAVFSLILPYIIAFMAVIGLVVFLFYKFLLL